MTLKPEHFFKALKAKQINFYAGVPDSLLRHICAYIADHLDDDQHVIAANEGSCVGIAVGYHLSSGKIPLVYLQNSGLGNTVNPLLSIADEEVYAIPMLLLIGWRGEPGIKDEPQHIKQGKVTPALLSSMEIPYSILSADSDYEAILNRALKSCLDRSKPYAILVRKNTFEKYIPQKDRSTNFELNREEAVKLVINSLTKSDVVVSTTGKTSREVFEYRVQLQHSHEKDFLTVGAMGHTSSIALGICLANSTRRVYCLDGDGSVLMHMGSLAINGFAKSCHNFKHIVINNGAHDSVGGQPTVGFDINFCDIASACNYTFVAEATTSQDIKEKLEQLKNHHGRAFLELKVNKGARQNLGRPTVSPKDNKQAFQHFLKNQTIV